MFIHNYDCLVDSFVFFSVTGEVWNALQPKRSFSFLFVPFQG